MNGMNERMKDGVDWSLIPIPTFRIQDIMQIHNVGNSLMGQNNDQFSTVCVVIPTVWEEQKQPLCVACPFTF